LALIFRIFFINILFLRLGRLWSFTTSLGLQFDIPASITYIYNCVAIDICILDPQRACFHHQFKRGPPPSVSTCIVEYTLVNIIIVEYNLVNILTVEYTLESNIIVEYNLVNNIIVEYTYSKQYYSGIHLY